MCDHAWRRVYEESILGGVFPAGWECLECGMWISTEQAGPGMGGTAVGEVRLTGPHGGHGTCSDGRRYKSQILYPDGRLEIEYV